ncbi:hypothetical protein [Streptomyces sp. NPDC002520]
MRLPPPSPPPLLGLPFCLAAAAALAPLSPALAHAETSSCSAPGDRAFPVTAGIRGGPASYEAGGGYGTWYIDLTNTTRQTCTDVHPVVVLVDDKRSLKPSQPKLDFYDGSHARPVRFETTDEQELVGVLDADGFRGFTVAAGKTVSVKVRLALTSDTAPDHVTANAAVVQRRGQDGDWIGESNEYRFEVADEQDAQGNGDTGEAEEPNRSEDSDGTQDADGTQDSDGTGTGSAHTPSGNPPGNPSGDPSDKSSGSDTPVGASPTATSPGASISTGTGTGTGTTSLNPGTTSTLTPRPNPDSPSDPPLPFADDAQEAGERARELASTGPDFTRGVLASAIALLAVGGAVLALTRRRR